MRASLGVWSLTLLLVSAASGRDLYVNPDTGADSADALAAVEGNGHAPVKTIAKGLSLAKAGDTVHLAARTEPYREAILIRDQSGEPGKPIVIDGHGATLGGCDPLKPSDWQQEAPGLYKSTTLYAALKGDDSVIQRVFFLFDGKMQRMDRTSKGAKAPWKKPQELAPGEWTFSPESSTFYIKLDPARKLDSSGVEIPYRKNGVATRGERNEHWIIRNVTVANVLNDGFNLHTNCRNVRFENIAALSCGDDGFSAHEGCDCEVDGYLAMDNSTGFANGFGSHVTLRNAYLAGNHANEVLQIHDTTFEIRDTLIVAGATRPVVIRGNADKNQVCRGSFENVLIVSDGIRPKPFEVDKSAVLTAKRLTTIGLSWQVAGEVQISQSVIASGGSRCLLEVKSKDAWKPQQVVYDMERFAVGEQAVHDFAAFQKAVGVDDSSRLQPIRGELLQQLKDLQPVLAPLGADLKGLPLPHQK